MLVLRYSWERFISSLVLLDEQKSFPLTMFYPLDHTDYSMDQVYY